MSASEFFPGPPPSSDGKALACALADAAFISRSLTLKFSQAEPEALPSTLSSPGVREEVRDMACHRLSV